MTTDRVGKLLEHEPLRDALIQTVVDYAGAHEDDCPCDDTCRCCYKPFNDLVNKFCQEIEAWRPLATLEGRDGK